MLEHVAAERSATHHCVVVQVCGAPTAEVCRAALQLIDAVQDPLRQRPLVKSTTPVAGQALEGACQGRVAEGLIGWWRLTTRQIQRLKGGTVVDSEALRQCQGAQKTWAGFEACLLYTSPSPRD